jgi:hypothetical protein
MSTGVDNLVGIFKKIRLPILLRIPKPPKSLTLYSISAIATHAFLPLNRFLNR